MKSIIELGGFAEDEDAIDGTEEEFELFNYFLAQDYVEAMFEEDFEMLGEFSSCLLDDIIYWIDYDGKHDGQRTRKELMNGSLITNKNRTFLEAIYDAKHGTLAETYISRGIVTPKLVLAVVLSKCDEDDIEPSAYIGDESYKKEDYDKLFKEFYDLIEIEYTKAEDKKEFLKAIKNNYGRIRIYKDKNRVVPSSYNWVKELKKIEKESYQYVKK